MNPLRVSIVGAGKRVIEAALPALYAARADFAIHAVFARADRSLTTPDGGTMPVRALASLTAADVAATDAFYVAVGKGAVATVLRSLTRFDVSKKTLLLDTPVLLWKQVHHLALIERFGRGMVTEDCIALAWYDTVAAFRKARGLGPPAAVEFHYSAYKYHGLAMAKTLLDDPTIASGKVVGRRSATPQRDLRFAKGGRCVVDEPRDYSRGWTTLRWQDVTISDANPGAGDGPNHERLQIVLEGAACVGFRIGAVQTRLDAAEISLQQCANPQVSVTARMEDWKRIGFLRLLRGLRAGDPGYSILAGLDDSLVDMQLEKLGSYRRNPLTSIDRGSARFILSLVSRIVGRG
jgi:hypothetical protein